VASRIQEVHKFECRIPAPKTRGLQNLHRQFKSARRLQSLKSGLKLQVLAVLNGGHLQIKNLHPGYKFDWGASKFISKIVRL